LLVLLAGCVHPIGADKVGPRQSYSQVNRSALNSTHCSSETQLVLHRYDLEDQFRKDPKGALTALHNRAAWDERRDILFALAELNYLQADRQRHSVKPGEPRKAADYYLSSAIYAYWFLFGHGPEPQPDGYDRRFRFACELYNHALAQGLRDTNSPDASLVLASGSRALPNGPVDVRFTAVNFKWKFEQIEKFLPADDYTVRGLGVRDRPSGLGAPIIVVGKTLEETRFPRRFPATVFLRVPGSVKDWSEGKLDLSLELYSSFQTGEVQVDGKTVPLEADLTAPLAWGMNDSYVWKLGSQQFFSPVERIHSSIYFTQPYEPGLVPVVFVHGTFSSPIWWAEMWNTLRSDRALREGCQFWNFIYNSGNPISMSAASLRAALLKKVQELDPEGKDPALRQMVIIGHSQGGLLTKLVATDTGDALWRTVSSKDLDQLKVTPEIRQQLRTNFFFTHLSCVGSVIFISTPHRGSYRATSFVRTIAHKFMTLPQNVLNAPSSIEQLHQQLGLPKEIREVVPSSLDAMSPHNKYLLALADIPTAPEIKAHSIVAIKGDDQPPDGADGVVKYTSAHVPYVQSEFIVRSSHSCQDKPTTIEEVRRILLEHLTQIGKTNAPSSVVGR
jgi:pimeloyl-ACP methyl ester carboxylesterase